jgi:hypothetical protein
MPTKKISSRWNCKQKKKKNKRKKKNINSNSFLYSYTNKTPTLAGGPIHTGRPSEKQ